MSSDGYAAVIVGRSPRIVRCLTSWGAATAVTITGDAEHGYAVAVAGEAAGVRRTLREATTLAIAAHRGTSGRSRPAGPAGGRSRPAGPAGGRLAAIVTSDAAAGIMGGLGQAALGIVLLLALVSGCIPMPGVSP